MVQIIEPSFRPIVAGRVIDLDEPEALETVWCHGHDALKHIEVAGRTCYKSHDRITDASARTFGAMICRNGHESVLEHWGVTAQAVGDRGLSHELVRHRPGIVFSQESTRYCNYGKEKFGNEINVIKPLDIPGPEEAVGLADGIDEKYANWWDSMCAAEEHYLKAIEQGRKPEHARSCLPLGLKVEIVTTANLRQWRYIFKLRVQNPRAHPMIRLVFSKGLRLFRKWFAPLFDDIYAPEFDIGTDEDVQRVRFEAHTDDDLLAEMARRGMILPNAILD